VPIYEYRCPNGHTFEAFQKMSDPPVEACTVCGEGPVEKLLFPVAVHFKGSGFYSTDYGRKGQKPGAKEGESSGTSEKASADKGSKETSTSSGDSSSSGSTGTGGSGEKKTPPKKD
jgi:putative FmdB family regulatory protein